MSTRRYIFLSFIVFFVIETHSLSTVSFPQHKAGGLVTCWTTSHIERQAYINTRTHSYSFAISGVYLTTVLSIFSSQFTPKSGEVAKDHTIPGIKHATLLLRGNSAQIVQMNYKERVITLFK